MKRKASISHEAAIVKELRDDPAFVMEYLRAAMRDADEPKALLIALRQVVKARGITKMAKRARMEGECLRRVLSPDGDPRFSTIAAILNAIGLRLSVEPASGC